MLPVKPRNSGTVGATLTRLCGVRNPVIDVPEALQGVFHVNGVPHSYWAAHPERGKVWVVNLITRSYVALAIMKIDAAKQS